MDSKPGFETWAKQADEWVEDDEIEDMDAFLADVRAMKAQKAQHKLDNPEPAEPEHEPLRDRLDALKQGDFDCRECVCGYSCGTDAAWEKHLARDAGTHYAAWADPADPTRSSCARWPADGHCKCRIACSLSALEDSAALVMPGIYIGSIIAAWNAEALSALGITDVLDISRKKYERHEDKFKYWIITDVKDNPTVNLTRYFRKSIEYFDQIEQAGGSVFVHCHWGQSRSATLILAYMMHKNQISFDKAIETMRQTRPEAKPNSAFQYQLRKFGAELGLEPKPEQPGHLSDSD